MLFDCRVTAVKYMLYSLIFWTLNTDFFFLEIISSSFISYSNLSFYHLDRSK